MRLPFSYLNQSACRSPSLDPILPAAGLSATLELVLRTAQEIAYLDVRRLIILEGTAEGLLQAARNLFHRQPLTVFSFCRSLKLREQHLAQTVHLLIVQVVLHECLLFLLCQIVAQPFFFYLLFQLGIELVVFDGRLEVDAAFNSHADS